MTVRIVTDTNVNLPPDLVRQCRITLVPAIIIFGDQSLKEGLEISTTEVIERMKHGAESPKTSQPPPHDFELAYRSLLDKEPAAAILSIHLTGAQSGTLRSAEEAAAKVRADFPRARIEVFDSQAFSIAQSLMVYEAGSMAARGSTLKSIVDRMNHMRERTRLFFILDTLDFAYRGGRLGRAAHLVGSLLNIKVVLTFLEGELVPYARFRTMRKAMAKLASLAAGAAAGADELQIAVGYAVHRGQASRLAEELKEQLMPELLLFHEIGPALAVHAGPGAIGIAWYAGDKPIQA
jgi:DegV family protein with EDD domain